MADTKGYVKGDWNAYCDYCEGQYLASDLRTDYWGFKACSKDYTKPNPQMFVRILPEKITVSWARPEDGTTAYQNSAQTFKVLGVPQFDIGAQSSDFNKDTCWNFDVTGILADANVFMPSPRSGLTVDCIYTISVVGTSSFKVIIGSSVITPPSAIIVGNVNIFPGQIALFQSNKVNNTWTRI